MKSRYCANATHTSYKSEETCDTINTSRCTRVSEQDSRFTRVINTSNGVYVLNSNLYPRKAT